MHISTKVEAVRAGAASAAWYAVEITGDNIVTILTIILLSSQIFVLLPKITHTANKLRRWATGSRASNGGEQ